MRSLENLPEQATLITALRVHSSGRAYSSLIHLPILPQFDNCLAARIEGKSSRARLGLLIHFTAPTVHPGFEGTLILEMINLGPAPILLQPDVPIAQLIVEEVMGRPLWNPSQFQGQRTPAGVPRKRRASRKQRPK